MNFIVHVSFAILVILIGALLSSVSSETIGIPVVGGLMRFSFGIATLGAQIWLFTAALYLRARSTTQFDMTVAAETLVALGVFGLITGIVLAVVAAPRANIILGSSTLKDFEPVLIPFGEGLFASAVAPLFATVLRQIEVLKYAPSIGSDSSGEELNRLRREAETTAKAFSQIKTEVEAASKTVAAFTEAAKSILDQLNRVSKNIEDAKGAIPAALGAVAIGISGSAAGVTAAFVAMADQIRLNANQASNAFVTTADQIRTSGNQVSAAISNTADQIRTSGNHVSAGFAATNSALQDFTTKAVSSAETTKRMTAEFEQLAKEAQAATGVLKRLQQLVETVTDFLRPEKP